VSSSRIGKIETMARLERLEHELDGSAARRESEDTPLHQTLGGSVWVRIDHRARRAGPREHGR